MKRWLLYSLWISLVVGCHTTYSGKYSLEIREVDEGIYDVILDSRLRQDGTGWRALAASRAEAAIRKEFERLGLPGAVVRITGVNAFQNDWVMVTATAGDLRVETLADNPKYQSIRNAWSKNGLPPPSKIVRGHFYVGREQ